MFLFLAPCAFDHGLEVPVRQDEIHSNAEFEFSSRPVFCYSGDQVKILVLGYEEQRLTTVCSEITDTLSS